MAKPKDGDGSGPENRRGASPLEFDPLAIRHFLDAKMLRWQRPAYPIQE